MSLNIVEYKDRIRRMYQEAFETLESENIDAESYVNYVSELMPYVTLRTGNVDITSEGEEIDIYEIEIIAEVYAGFASKNDGEGDEDIDRFIYKVIHYFNQRELLQCGYNDSAVDYRIAPNDLEYARITNSSGYRQTPTGGATLEAKKLTTFRHFLRAYDPINQVYN